MKNTLQRLWTWMTGLDLKIDGAMIAAAVVEVPRWYVAFAAIREPAWAAVPMGLLLAWGASAGWKAYFENRRRWLLLTINVVSLAGALIVIAPVLFAMTWMPLEEVDLSKVLPMEGLALWAGTLAVTTFVPLIQIAAVKVYQHDDEPPVAKAVVAKTPAKTEPAKPVAKTVVASVPATAQERRNAIMAHLRNGWGGEIAQADVVSQMVGETGKDASTVYRDLQSLENAGLIVRNGDGVVRLQDGSGGFDGNETGALA